MSQKSPLEPHIGPNELAKSGDKRLKLFEVWISLSSPCPPSVGPTSEIRPKDVGIPKHTDLLTVVLTTQRRGRITRKDYVRTLQLKKDSLSFFRFLGAHVRVYLS